MNVSPNVLAALIVARKTGSEPLTSGGEPLGFDLLGFWQWACSDLMGNSLRGILAEYLVAAALGCTSATRTEWDAYDVRTPDGIRVEVKSAAYVQTWHQTKLSQISYDIRPTFGWTAETNSFSKNQVRQAEVYVFCLLAHQDKATVDPLDLDQWEFYCLQTAVLDARLGTQKRLSHGRLMTLKPKKATFRELPDVVRQLSCVT